MKLGNKSFGFSKQLVAPRVGAWIETLVVVEPVLV